VATLLILTRRAGETIHIGNDVVITVIRVRGAQVRLGISAPDDVAIDRGEIFDKKQIEAEIAARLRS